MFFIKQISFGILFALANVAVFAWSVSEWWSQKAEYLYLV